MATIQLNISENLKKELIAFYNQELAKTKARLREIQDALDQLTTPTDDANQIQFGSFKSDRQTYDSNWSWVRKIIYVIGKSGKCVTSRYIIDKVKELEPDLSFDTVQRSVTGSISVYSKKGQVGRYTDDNGNYFVGLRNWFNSDSSVKEEYKHEREKKQTPSLTLEN